QGPQHASTTLLSERITSFDIRSVETLLATVGPLLATPMAVDGPAGCDSVQHYRGAGDYSTGDKQFHRSGYLWRQAARFDTAGGACYGSGGGGTGAGGRRNLRGRTGELDGHQRVARRPCRPSAAAGFHVSHGSYAG